MSHRVLSYIGLGSNLNNPKLQLKQAINSLEHMPQTTLIKTSKFYNNPALIHPSRPNEVQADFENAVIAISTQLSAQQLLDKCMQIENNQGRIRNEAWCARTIDLDILLYGDMIINDKNLKIPHPHMLGRDFVIKPLYEIAENLILPCGTPLKAIYDLSLKL